MTADDLVKAWVRDKFLASPQYLNNTLHFGEAKDIAVESADVQPYCGCWSEFTRDDGYEMVAKLTGKFGEYSYTYGLWGNLPEFIRELDSYQYSYPVCPYDEEDY